MSSDEPHPSVSVTICLFDSARYVAETLRSVLGQTYTDFEVVLVDDGSTDGCAERIRESFRDGRLRLVAQPHRGLGHARARSLLEARGEYVAIVDHDDCWEEDKLALQVSALRQRPEVGLAFSDCAYVDGSGRPIGRLSERFDLESLDLRAGRARRELLTRGCFIEASTVFARASVLSAAGGFDPGYNYVEDIDLWLRVARRSALFCQPLPLVRRRIHDGQFTRRHPDVALDEQLRLLRPIRARPSHPPEVRRAVGDYLLGQHRTCARQLLRQHRPIASLRATAGMLLLPGRVLDLCRHSLSRGTLGRAVEQALCSARRWGEHGARWTWERLRRLLVGRRTRPADAPEIWIDGTPLAEPPAGYFNLLVELIRALLCWCDEDWRVHVTLPAAGRAPLAERLGVEADRLQMHRVGIGRLHWTAQHRQLQSFSLVALALGGVAAPASIAAGLASPVVLGCCAALGLAAAAILADAGLAGLATELGRARLPLLARALRFLQLRLPPWRPFKGKEAVELVVWQGRFRHARSRKVAWVPDLTTRVHPDLHTPGNVAEFEEYLHYVERRAETIVTLSKNSRRDIIDRLRVDPESVRLMPVPVNPAFSTGKVMAGVPARYGLEQPYLLCVGTLEPRKNLRRLVRAYERVLGTEAEVPLLVLAGPDGWDEGLGRALVESDSYPMIRRIGCVPFEHLPSLYRLASAVVYPSLYEGFGLPVIEAMCCSSLVVTAALASLPRRLMEGLFTFDPYCTDAIASALRAVLRMEPEAAVAYREGCRSRAASLLAEWGRLPPLPGLSPPRPEETCESASLSRSSA